MELTKWLKTSTSTTKLTHSIRILLARSLGSLVLHKKCASPRFARRSFVLFAEEKKEEKESEATGGLSSSLPLQLSLVGQARFPFLVIRDCRVEGGGEGLGCSVGCGWLCAGGSGEGGLDHRGRRAHSVGYAGWTIRCYNRRNDRRLGGKSGAQPASSS